MARVKDPLTRRVGSMGGRPREFVCGVDVFLGRVSCLARVGLCVCVFRLVLLPCSLLVSSQYAFLLSPTHRHVLIPL